MRIPERIQYLNDNKIKGDITTIANLFGLNDSTVSDIVSGRFVGTHGEKVLQKLEEMIDERKAAAKILSEKYKKKISDSH